MRGVAVVLTILLSGLLFAPASAEAGGLLDLLFGPRQPQPAPYAPLEFDVRPRGFGEGRSARARHPRYDYKKALAKRQTPRVVVKIDPVAEPDWRLRDPTLRRGDIVVLPNGPVVFDGPSGDTHEVSDFQPLAESRVPAALQRQVRMMVAGRWISDPRSAVKTALTHGRRHGRARTTGMRETSMRETWAAGR